MALQSELRCIACGVKAVQKTNTDGEIVFVFPCDCSNPIAVPEHVAVADVIWNTNKAVHCNSAAMWRSLWDLHKALDPKCSRKNCKWTETEKDVVAQIDNIFNPMDVARATIEIQRNPFSIFNIHMDIAYKKACVGDLSMYNRILKNLNN